MKEEEMLYCLIAFILGWLVSRQMGNGFRVGGEGEESEVWACDIFDGGTYECKHKRDLSDENLWDDLQLKFKSKGACSASCVDPAVLEKDAEKKEESMPERYYCHPKTGACLKSKNKEGKYSNNRCNNACFDPNVYDGLWCQFDDQCYDNGHGCADIGGWDNPPKRVGVKNVKGKVKWGKCKCPNGEKYSFLGGCPGSAATIRTIREYGAGPKEKFTDAIRRLVDG